MKSMRDRRPEALSVRRRTFFSLLAGALTLGLTVRPQGKSTAEWPELQFPARELTVIASARSSPEAWIKALAALSVRFPIETLERAP